MTIEWDHDLETGIPIIDQQHKELIVLLRRLRKLTFGKEDFTATINELRNYANTHFETEENYMLTANYPRYKEHKQWHDRFVKQLEITYEKLKDDNNITDLGYELYIFAEDWILKHYTDEDIKFAQYFKEHS